MTVLMLFFDFSGAYFQTRITLFSNVSENIFFLRDVKQSVVIPTNTNIHVTDMMFVLSQNTIPMYRET